MARCLDRDRETCRIRTLLLSAGGCLPSVVDEKGPLAEGTAAPTSLGSGAGSAGCAKLPMKGLLSCDGPGLLSEETLGGVAVSLAMACCWTVLLGHAISSTGGMELLLQAALSRNGPELLAEEA